MQCAVKRENNVPVRRSNARKENVPAQKFLTVHDVNKVSPESVSEGAVEDVD